MREPIGEVGMAVVGVATREAGGAVVAGVSTGGAVVVVVVVVVVLGLLLEPSPSSSPSN